MPSNVAVITALLAPEYIELTHDDDFRGVDFRLVVVSKTFVGMSGPQVRAPFGR